MALHLPQLSLKHAGITPAVRRAYGRALQQERAKMLEAASNGYADVHASINLPTDKKQLGPVERLVKKHKHAKLVIVIGIGGSNLGTMAVQEALLGKQHNLHPGKRARILYADTVDADALASIIRTLDEHLARREHVVINVVSKSGGTAETAANAQVLLQQLAKRKLALSKHVVATTDEGSQLWRLAHTLGIACLAIPKNVGGRYSVFSPVGLFPLALLGINTRKLLAGAAAMRKECLKQDENPAMDRALMLANALANKRSIADNFYFKTDLESIGKWYRQLMGESCGKEWNRAHTKRIWQGMTPTVSIGSTDLHSMAQLYFGGPQDKFHTLITVEKWRQDMTLPQQHAFTALAADIKGRKLSTIMEAIAQGVAGVLEEQQRPYARITLSACNEETIGALLQLHMMEMMYLGALLDVNPFDQPNVEAYKIATKRVLAKGAK